MTYVEFSHKIAHETKTATIREKFFISAIPYNKKHVHILFLGQC
jgi:hypothetical protein